MFLTACSLIWSALTNMDKTKSKFFILYRK